jgi:hypothetical protein
MARINRRVRTRLQHGGDGLTRAQRERLLVGRVFMGTGPSFGGSADAMRAAWRKHRAELMATPELKPGRRPWAFFVLELGCDPGPAREWSGQLDALMDRGLIGAEEAIGIEALHPELSPTTAREFCQSFENEKVVRAMGLDDYLLGRQASEFAAAARWHEWRGRPEVAERWARRAELVRMCIVASD